MKKLQANGFNERQALEDILSALEYDTEKEEKELLEPILQTRGLTRMKKAKLTKAICTKPGFEPFFLDILKAVRPFSKMVAEIYTFLNLNKTTASYNASKFLVGFENAQAELEFDLSNFPTEMLKIIDEAERFGAVVELRFPSISLEEPATDWYSSQAWSHWRDVSPKFDGDFYDHGFHQALSYAHAILSRSAPQYTETAKEIIVPILDRLAAICEFVNDLIGSPDRSIYWGGVSSHPARSHIVRDSQAQAYLAHLQIGNYQSMAHGLYSTFRDFAISVDRWESRWIKRNDHTHWLESKLHQSLPDISPEEYLEFLRGLAIDYTEKLDLVAPITQEYSYKEVFDSLKKFLMLPFWKYRPYLYELWTVAHVLRIAQHCSWEVDLQVQKNPQGDLVEWVLPANQAQQPVATIGGESGGICCWARRMTYHPGTGAKLEPDLRLTTSVPAYHDLIVVENKDKARPTITEAGGILETYVGGTCAESVWLVNYGEFPELSKHLQARWPGRRVHIESNFKPDSIPADFDEEIEDVLQRHLTTRSDTRQPQPQKAGGSPGLFALEATLSWQGLPRDLDLHTWIHDADGDHCIFFGEKGSLDAPPYAQLDQDHIQGNGQETVRIKSGEFEWVVIAVHNYSADAPLSRSNAVLSLNLDGRNKIVLRVPTSGDGRWWQVVRLNRNENEIQVLHTLNHNPPV